MLLDIRQYVSYNKRKENVAREENNHWQNGQGLQTAVGYRKEHHIRNPIKSRDVYLPIKLQPRTNYLKLFIGW